MSLIKKLPAYLSFVWIALFIISLIPLFWNYGGLAFMLGIFSIPILTILCIWMIIQGIIQISSKKNKADGTFNIIVAAIVIAFTIALGLFIFVGMSFT